MAMNIFVDIPVFISPTEAIGNATGIVKFARQPELREPLDWTVHGTVPSPFFDLLKSSPVVAIAPSDSGDYEAVALLDGVVLENVEDLPGFAKYLRHEYGVIYVEY